MKLNVYTFASMVNTTNPETSMFAIMVATKLEKSYGIVERSIDNKNPRTLSALIRFSLDCYEEYMSNLHPDLNITEKEYWETFAEYLGQIRSLCDWKEEKSPISILNSTLIMRKRNSKKELSK